MEVTYRCLSLAGNLHGGIGYGIGRHEDAERATQLAMEAAVKDMIHISTWRGQLYHDLVGKKNNVKVMLMSRGPAHDVPARGDYLIETAMSLAGIENYTARILGPKRRNVYTIVQALFDCFHQVRTPEDLALSMGKRFLPLGRDRATGRSIMPEVDRYPKFIGEAKSQN